ncbi:MAG: ribosomal protein S18 acetylase RimI-like enzyme [Pseudohongiellaceae bacterium]|jgi:ribosomal protein S18 acetylase RimI-like enzyme
MENPEDYELVAEVVMVEDFMRLRKVSGLSPRPESAAAIGLKNSLYGVHIRHEALVVGMGRVIGDGSLNFDVVDVAVAPEYQGFGLGRMIMEALMAYLNAAATPGAYITLMADLPALYEKFGFAFSSPGSEGMYYLWDKK